MRYGIERETTTIDDQGSTLTVIRKIRDFDVAKTIKQFKIRVKVKDAKEEMAEFIKHTEKIRDKKLDGTLVYLDEDPTLLPAFVVSYPKFNEDDCYFVISSWSELSN